LGHLVTFFIFLWLCLAIISKPSLAEAPVETPARFEGSDSCVTCHSVQHSEWQGSMMHFGARSPVFQAMEVTVRKLTGRFGPHDSKNPTFCINCHAPLSAYHNEMAGVSRGEPTAHALGNVGGEGVSCTFCHSASAPKLRKAPEKGALGDGLSNALFFFAPTFTLVGPTESDSDDPKPAASSYHNRGFNPKPAASRFLKSSEFCGACHNVHLPNSFDVGTEEPFQREQNTYTEWKNGPYSGKNNPWGKEVGCRDCHMSLYGLRDKSTGEDFAPGSFPNTHISSSKGALRRHAIHQFLGVSLPLSNDAELPATANDERERLLKKAVSLTVTGKTVATNTLGFEITLLNKGAGHRVPSGIPERELWVEVLVKDEMGEVVYQSGALTDQPHPELGEATPDGLIGDEDLQDVFYRVEPQSMEIRAKKMGPDFNLRPFADRGLVQFGNAFLRTKGKGREKVAAFFLADQVDSTRSLPVLKPVNIRYQVPLVSYLKNHPNARIANFEVVARLRYRTFHPYLLRALAAREPEFVTEKLVDQNTIVTMAQRATAVSVSFDPTKTSGPETRSFPDSPDLTYYDFDRAPKRWRFYFAAATFDRAEQTCQSGGCRLPGSDEFRGLGLTNHAFTPTDNREELTKERWTSDFEKKDGIKTYQKTFVFVPSRKNEPNDSSARRDLASLDKKYFACVCDPGEQP
jgi:hypothetical protein